MQLFQKTEKNPQLQHQISPLKLSLQKKFYIP
jgi:hypothetical protein